MKKRLFSLILSLAMVFTMLAPAASAAPKGDGPLTHHGLQGEYYLVQDTSGYPYTTLKGIYVDPNIAFSDTESMLSKRTGASDWAGARWTGRLVAPATGEYTFYFYSDNGARLYVGDMETPIIDWWVNQWDIEQKSAPIHLEEGQAYDFKMDWFEATGGSHVYVRWSNDQGMEKTEIPASAFYLPADFAGPIVDDVNTDNAQLDKDQGLGGTITLTGANFAEGINAELVTLGGSSLEPQAVMETVSVSDTELVLGVPETVNPGAYRIQLKQDMYIQNADEYILVTSSSGSEIARSEHPRPDWKRDKWMNLNGVWDFEFDPDKVGEDEAWYENRDYALKINVPFPWESPASGIEDGSYLGTAWYERNLNLDDSWFAEGEQIFLKFGAVDWFCTLYVNGEKVGDHEGGYTPFEFNITDYVQAGDNKITLEVNDEASYGKDEYPALVGKQGHNAPCGYTHTSGIWQTVYLEGRSSTYMDYAHANPDIDNSTVQFDLKVQSDADKAVTVAYDFQSVLWDDEKGENIETGSTISGTQEITLKAGENVVSLEPIAIENQKLWNYDSPNLYEGTIRLLDGETELDNVSTYFGQRKVSTEKYDGRDYEYIYVNNEPVFLSGLLDQGFWEEGVYTAPSEEALKYDIKAMRDRGFNMIRKHLKIEDPLQYYWADRLGMFVWQDMPHATYMNAKSNGGETPGRAVYEYALENMLNRDYNHPSVIAVMLFNETWGIDHNGQKASDGMTTNEWIQHLYYKTKEINPHLLVEDMSPCNNDHIQPTDLNTFHMYPKGYQGSKNTVADRERNTYPGSANNFWGGFRQESEPWLNSEFGGVAAFDGDYDVSWCFKYQTDIQRQYEKLNGYVYTEPYDIEYERNGVLTYDRRDKIFGYEDVAYGGDMSIIDLNQPNYVGVDIDPALKAAPGSQYTAPVVAMNWSGETLENPVLKWRFDATDIYGNYITTGKSGEVPMDFAPYTREQHDISFSLPSQKCVGTFTVWIENNGEKIAKNFVNVIVTNGKDTAPVSILTEDSAVLRQAAADSNTIQNGVGAITYSYTLPEGIGADVLNSMRVIVEASSLKDASINHGIDNSAFSQTTVGSERPSDMTVSINGHEVGTVYLPDNPRDIRGTLTLTPGEGNGSSAGNYGYLVNLDIPDSVLETLKEELAQDSTFTVSYSVKEDAEHANGLRIYNENNGRYAVNPMVILNPADITGETVTMESDNYSVESEGSFYARYNAETNTGYKVDVAENGEVTLSKVDGTVLATADADASCVKATFFDDHITVYANNNPVPVIDLYDYSGFSGIAQAIGGTLTVAPESYDVLSSGDVQADVQFADSFNVEKTFGERYTLMRGDKNRPNDSEKSDGVWNGSNENNNLYMEADWGNKAIINNTESTDLVAEADITLTEVNPGTNGNMGLIVRGSNYLENVDGADGYYAGLGEGYIQVGRMHNGWTELAKVDAPVAVGETHRLRVVAIGSRIRVYLDDETEPRVDVYDGTYPSGSVALRGFRCKGIFDDVVVSTAPRYEADFENGSIAEWTSTGEAWALDGGAITASAEATALVGNAGWTDYELSADVSVAEGGKAGLAVRAGVQKERVSGYYVALDEAADTIQVIRSMSGVENVLEEASMEVAADTVYNLKARVVNNTVRVYVDGSDEAILVARINEFGNGKAGLSVLSGTATFDNVQVKDQFIYEEDFSDGCLDGWNIISGDFSVQDNILTLKDATGKKMVDGYTTWDDYVIQAKVKLDVRQDVKSNAGYIFRCSDFDVGQDDQYGYVSGINYNARATTGEEASGLETGDIQYGWRPIMNDHSFQIDPSQWYDFEVKAIGNQITVSVNGQEYYTVEDDAYSYGMIGLRNFNSGLQVQDLKVIPAEEYQQEVPSEHMLTVTFPTTVELSIDGESQTIANLIGAYKDVVMADTELNLTFTPRVDGREIAGVTVNDEAIAEDSFDAAEYVYSAAMPNADTTIELGFTLVDKQNLRAAIEIAEGRAGEADAAVPSVKEKYEAALQAAKDVEAKKTATQDEINTAWSDLIDALHYLSFVAGDKSQLDIPMEIAYSINRDLFTPDSLKALDEAYAAAEDLLDDEEVLEADITAAVDALYDAIYGLVYRADVTELEALVTKGDSIVANADQYIQNEAWTAFETSLEEAKTVLANENATQDAVDTAAEDLAAAISALRLIPDKDALEALIGEAEAINTNKYTAKSVATMKAALSTAKAVLNDAEATEEEVADAVEALENSIDGLVEKNTSTGSKNSGSTSANVGNAYGAAGVVSASQSVAANAYVVSDTTVNFTLKRGSAYCFKMTVVNGNSMVPSFTAGNGDVLKTQFVAKIGNDYYYRVYATGTPGQSTGVYTTLPGNAAVKHCTVTIG